MSELGPECSSELGMRGGEQLPFLNSRCFDDGLIVPVHELMHLLGFVHKHNRTPVLVWSWCLSCSQAMKLILIHAAKMMMVEVGKSWENWVYSTFQPKHCFWKHKFWSFQYSNMKTAGIYFDWCHKRKNISNWLRIDLPVRPKLTANFQETGSWNTTALRITYAISYGGQYWEMLVHLKQWINSKLIQKKTLFLCLSGLRIIFYEAPFLQFYPTFQLIWRELSSNLAICCPMSPSSSHVNLSSVSWLLLFATAKPILSSMSPEIVFATSFYRRK